MQASNPHIVIGAGNLFAFRADESGYWLDRCSLNDLECSESIELPEAPKRIVYDDGRDGLHFLFVGGEPASSIGYYHLESKLWIDQPIDDRSFAGSLLVGDSILVTLMGYSDDGRTAVEDNRIAVLNDQLQVDEYTTVGNVPNLMLVMESKLFVSSGRSGVVIEEVSLEEGRVNQRYYIAETGSAIAMTSIEDSLYILTPENVYRLQSDGSVDSKKLTGRTESQWNY
ncbi:hypothetical protein DUZ99_12645 [Xylanibacillus composti]|uniref:Uncharacterized protein n=1 Tax=Xylanibacillus composti TaxID=1572762 RepID=A0A8J4H478_9BACL|nr:hypothetical protein [Xylanibacillus composti]MDT9725820.1 hypothetical protein [Xylanibacillus composti]GIQ69226.1 hypothetical protein XYCOK13_20500 [Xylanibacillus composti]